MNRKRRVLNILKSSMKNKFISDNRGGDYAYAVWEEDFDKVVDQIDDIIKKAIEWNCKEKQY